MRKSTLRIAASLFAVVLVTGTAWAGGQPNQRSHFAGNYAGSYTAAMSWGGSQVGYTSMSVGDNGMCVGRVTNHSVRLSGIITGTLTNQGEFFGRVAWNDGTVFLLRGTLRKASDGSLRGTLSQYASNGLMASGTVYLPAR